MGVLLLSTFDLWMWVADKFPQLVITLFVLITWWRYSTKKMDEKDATIRELNKYIREADKEVLSLVGDLKSVLSHIKINQEATTVSIDKAITKSTDKIMTKLEVISDKIIKHKDDATT